MKLINYSAGSHKGLYGSSERLKWWISHKFSPEELIFICMSFITADQPWYKFFLPNFLRYMDRLLQCDKKHYALYLPVQPITGGKSEQWTAQCRHAGQGSNSVVGSWLIQAYENSESYYRERGADVVRRTECKKNGLFFYNDRKHSKQKLVKNKKIEEQRNEASQRTGQTWRLTKAPQNIVFCAYIGWYL